MIETSTQDPVEVMAPFARIVGQWQNTEMIELVHHIEWGVDKRTINMHSHAPDGTLLSEGRWFWHSGEGVIKGYAVAIEMPVEFFDYTVTAFEDNKLTMALTSYTPTGEATKHIETWTFSDDNHYTFALHSKTPDGLVKTLEFGFERRAS